MKVSVITPNYNGKKLLKGYLKSLNEDSQLIGEVIIIDNASVDGSVEYLKKNSFDFPVRVIENDENRGFAPAVNQGIAKAENEYIFSLNNDTEIRKGSLKAMAELMSSDDGIFSIQAKMLQYSNRNLIDDAGDEYNLLGWTKKMGEGQNSSEYMQTSEIFSACAGAAMYRKSLLEELGMFDENFFAYMEDVDLSVRSKINGYRSLLCPEAEVYHIGSATTGSRYNEFKVKTASRNNVWTVYKNLPAAMKIVNFIFLFFGFTVKYLFFLRKGFGKIYLSGISEGLKTRKKLDRVEFQRKNLKNYFKLEYKLIVNTFKFLKK